MPRPPPPSMPTPLRHSYRALLRAITYLPDSAARKYWHETAVDRFRVNANKCKGVWKHQEREQLVNRFHSDKAISKVKQTARIVERASQGSLPELKKVLFQTYGRLGKRRRELLADLLATDESTVPEDNAALEALILKPTEKRHHRDPLNSKLAAFLKDQRANQPAEATTLPIKRLTPDIPSENIWGRPVPKKLKESMRRQFLIHIFSRVLPPLPEDDWNKLRDLATGAIPIEDPPTRRIRGSHMHPAWGKNEEELHIRYNAEVGSRKLEMFKVENDPDGGATSILGDVQVSRDHIHNLTPRFMRRLYASIWSMSAMMKKDEATNQWVITWGQGRSPSQSGKITAPSADDVELFEGVEFEDSGESRDATATAPKKKENPPRSKKKREELKEIKFIENQLENQLENLPID